MGTRRILLALAVLGVAAILLYGSRREPGVTVLSPPAATEWPGRAWLHDGQRVDTNILSLSLGPAHCGWERILFLRMSRRLGEPTVTSDDLLEYVRDPENRWAGPNESVVRTLGRFEPDVPRPPDAMFTGYVYDGMELWRSNAGTNAIVYLRRADIWEQWPRSEVPIACA